jgi:hypothetical protein
MDIQVEAEVTQTPTDEESTEEVLFLLGLLDGHWWRAQDVASKCAALAGIADLSTLASYLCEEVTSPHRLQRRRSLLSGKSIMGAVDVFYQDSFNRDVPVVQVWSLAAQNLDDPPATEESRSSCSYPKSSAVE